MATPFDRESDTERIDPVPPGPVPPTWAPGEPPPATVPGMQQPPAFVPAAPEASDIPTEPVVGAPSAATTARGPKPRRTSASPTLLNIALAAGLLIAVAGVAYSIGRTTAPAATGGLVSDGGLGGGGNGNGNGPLGNGNGPFGGVGPDASFDLNGGGFADGDGRGFPGAGRGPMGGFGGFGGLGIEGTVEAVDADSITIRTADGLLVTVGIDADTAYHQQADASASDVKAGSTVIVQLDGGFRPGAGNGNDGSITLGSAGDITVVP
jgi:hypothetical protein